MLIDPGSIVTLLAGGAIAKLDGLGGEVVSDAYRGLKTILVDVYHFAAAPLLEKKPRDPDALKTAEADISPEAAADPQVLARVNALEAALAAISEAQWRSAGVVIEGLAAERDIALGKVSAVRRSVTIRDLRARRDIRIGDIEG
jgi:hypothetical protein